MIPRRTFTSSGASAVAHFVLPHDLQKAESDPRAYVSQYIHVQSLAENANQDLVRDLHLRVGDFFFEQIERHYNKGTLSLGQFFPAALTNEGYLKNHFSDLNARVAELMNGAIVDEDKTLERELLSIISISKFRFSPFTKPDFTLISKEGGKFPIWRGHLLCENGFFHGFLRRTSNSQECRLEYSKEAVAALIAYLEQRADGVRMPKDREVLEELHQLARFIGYGQLQELCQLRLNDFKDFLLDYFTEALEYNEYRWINIIFTALKDLDLGITFKQKLPGRIEAKVSSWDSTVCSYLEFFQDILEKITFENDDLLESLLKQPTLCFPKVKTVVFVGEPVDLRKHFPNLELGILNDVVGERDLVPEKWFRTCGMSSVIWYAGYYVSHLKGPKSLFYPLVSDEFVLQRASDLYRLSDTRAIENLILAGSSAITDRSLETAAGYLFGSTLTLLGPAEITYSGLAKMASASERKKVLHIGGFPKITQSDLEDLKKRGLEFEDLSLCLSNGETKLSLEGKGFVDSELLHALLEQYPDLTSLDLRGCPQLQPAHIVELIGNPKLLGLRSDAFSMDRDLGTDASFRWFRYDKSPALSLPRLLKDNRNLSSLEFHSCSLDTFEVCNAPPSKSLESIIIGSTTVSDQFLGALVERSPNLRSLSMIKCTGFSEEGLLAVLARDLPSLTHLCLVDGPQLSEKLLDALPKKLQDLTLGNTPKITDKVLKTFLSSRPSLTFHRRP